MSPFRAEVFYVICIDPLSYKLYEQGRIQGDRWAMPP